MIEANVDLGSRSDELVGELVNEIGARPAGSLAEMKALEWIREKLDGKYACTIDTFSFASLPVFFPYYSIAGFFFIISALLLPNFPWMALLAPGVAACLPDLNNWIGQRLPKRCVSHNLLALAPDCLPEQANLLFCAHVDTAPVLPSGYGARFFNPLRRQIFPVMQRTGWILAVLAGVSLIGIRYGAGVIAAAITITAIVALVLVSLDVWDQLGARSIYSAGAHDNASGVAVLLALAEQLDLDNLKHLKVGFLFTGAEEAGLWGARHAANSLAKAGCHPVVICVDMVGAGDSMRIMQGARWLRMVRTNQEINEWLGRSDHLAVAHTAVRRSSDFEAFIKKGIPAGWIESSGTQASWRAYHTQRDQLHLIDKETLGRASLMLSHLVDIMERNGYSPGNQ